MKRLIAITGGIGSGKSVVSRVVTALGRQVYDCDSEAKKLMDMSSEIKLRLQNEIDSAVIDRNGAIDRQRLASIVFNDAAMLMTLNEIVHKAVRDDIAAKMACMPDGMTLFVETAILYQSGLDRMADEVWDVTAPEELRISRVMNRNSCTRDEVVARIRSQAFVPETVHGNVAVIVNDGVKPLLPQIEFLFGRL